VIDAYNSNREVQGDSVSRPNLFMSEQSINLSDRLDQRKEIAESAFEMLGC
jgi:hypothetical protein